MFEKNKKLEVSPEELAVIEAALHTQSKILGVQASAGGSTARSKLNAVKRLLVRVEQETPQEHRRPCKSRFGWFGRSRSYS